ncbi:MULTISPECIES: DNA-3-methyladenine glycosylase family protein [unclassified Streptomyces]|uniref:DNA-3-methyladenine glycosylase family protein n=1 Tax=unclassified Streptomyces TaxID=2593676 RepID=UPI0022B6C56D|nr:MULTISPECIES: DNA-3-methyladenine glycosylase 2 family protein [unclassified Streptomyces]MCZ7414601.1 DNA-3-methyladenine glycosylase 2 family protein [Streptomyces sp. WMMC897]MCZ7431529.1 DNA-3-methyladenine glycosylase 2 family protein [Streptomyces sp. WMMC1477]
MSLTRSWAPPGPYDLRRSLGVLQRGPHDPACQVAPGAVWRASRTPQGPVTLRLVQGRARVTGTAWGPGAEWALDRLPTLLGAADRPEEFVAHHRLTREAHRRLPGLRLARTGLVLESLIPAVLEQKVTAIEAYRAWGRLLRRFGEPAPGPAEGRPEGLYVMPDPRGWALVPSWEWHRAGVDGKRAATVVRAARVAGRLEEAAAMALPEALARLRLVPGIGPWTAAETVQRSNGEPDAITVGDLHLPRQVGYALTGRRDTDDDGMLALLAPYVGQRHRAAQLILAGGPRMPRRAPRMYARDIARF